MLAQILKRWGNIRASYWFLPSVMAAGAEVVSEQRRQLAEHAQWLIDASLAALPDPADKARVKTAFDTA